MPGKESLTGLCQLVGLLISPLGCCADEKATIALRRPGPTEISEADALIYRLVRKAAGSQDTAPWSFWVVGPAGIREVTEQDDTQAPSA